MLSVYGTMPQLKDLSVAKKCVTYAFRNHTATCFKHRVRLVIQTGSTTKLLLLSATEERRKAVSVTALQEQDGRYDGKKNLQK